MKKTLLASALCMAFTAHVHAADYRVNAPDHAVCTGCTLSYDNVTVEAGAGLTLQNGAGLTGTDLTVLGEAGFDGSTANLTKVQVANGGSLALTGSSLTSGSLTADTGSRVSVEGGTFTVTGTGAEADKAMRSSGQVSIKKAALALDSLYVQGGEMTLESVTGTLGNVTAAAGALNVAFSSRDAGTIDTFVLSGGTARLQSVAVTGTLKGTLGRMTATDVSVGSLDTSVADITLERSTVTGASVIQSGKVTFKNGTTVNGVTQTQGSVYLNDEADATLARVGVTGTYSITGGTLEASNADFATLDAGGDGETSLKAGVTVDTLTVRDDATVFGDGAIAVGTLTMQGGSFVSDVPFTISGALNLQGGLFEVNNTTIDGNATVTGGTLDGSGLTFKKALVVKGGSVAAKNVTLERGLVAQGSGAAPTLDGTVRVQSGGGHAIDLTDGAGLTFGAGSTVDIDGTVFVAAGSTLTLGNESTLLARIAQDGTPNMTITGGGAVVNDGATLSFVFAPGFEGGTYVFADAGMLDADLTLVTDNTLYALQATETVGTYRVTMRAADELKNTTGATQNQAAALEAITKPVEPGTPDHGNAVYKSVTQYVTDTLQDPNATPEAKRDALRTVSGMAPSEAPVLQHVQTSTANQVFGVIGQRFAPPKGLASGDDAVRSGLWAHGVINRTEHDATASSAGFDADTEGLAIGFDGQPVDNLHVGGAYAYTTTDVTDAGRATEAESHMLLGYVEWQPAAWFVNGIVSYARTDYTESDNLAGNPVSHAYDAETFGLQVMTGYDLAVAGHRVTPEVGLRYFRTTQGDYVNGVGSLVKSDTAHVVTAVAGLNVAMDSVLKNGVTVTPALHVAATYDVKQAESGALVTMVNGASYRVEGEDLHAFGFELGAKVTAELTDNFAVSASYEGNLRKDFTSHTGWVKAMWSF